MVSGTNSGRSGRDAIGRDQHGDGARDRARAVVRRGRGSFEGIRKEKARTGSWTEALTADMPRDLAVLPRDARRATTGAAETAEREAMEADGARARGGRAAAGARTIDEAKMTSACASARDVPGRERRGVEWHGSGLDSDDGSLGLSIRRAHVRPGGAEIHRSAVCDDYSDTGEQSERKAKFRQRERRSPPSSAPVPSFDPSGRTVAPRSARRRATPSRAKSSTQTWRASPLTWRA